MTRNPRPVPPRKPPVVQSAPATSTSTLAEQMFAEAVSRHQAGRTSEAEIVYRAILIIHPGHAPAAYNLGLILQTSGRYGEAEIAYRHAIATKGDYVDAYCNLGTVLQELGRLDESVACYHQAIAIKPDFAMAHCNLGVTLKNQGKVEEAIVAYQKAIKLQPKYDWAHCNLGAALIDLDRLDDAMVACARATAINPQMAMAHFNLGAICKSSNRLDEAISCFRKAITINPDFVEPHFTMGQVLLSQGKFDEGWPEYEWRWKLREYSWLKNIHGEFSQPKWNGEDLTGKTIFIYAEQGLGDTMQYVRYVPDVVAKAGHVVMAVHPPLLKLFAQVPDIELIALDTKPLPPFDYHCPLLTLPRLFGTREGNIPAKVPYLHADPAEVARWHQRFAEAKGLRVGLVWSGNPTQKGDRLRSPRLPAMKPLFDIPGVTFICLQKGPGRVDLETHPLPANVIDLGDEITDFSDTAAIMAGLDLMISSCTSPLHLSGAMGVPTWGIIPFAPHFLWQLNRSDSPWYPTLRLYRQEKLGHDWSLPVGLMIKDLTALAESKAKG